MTDQVPAIIEAGVLTPLPDGNLIPSLIADAGDQAAWRYVDFFTSNIRNPNTRRAQACHDAVVEVDEFGLCQSIDIDLHGIPELRAEGAFKVTILRPTHAVTLAKSRHKRRVRLPTNSMLPICRPPDGPVP